MTGPYYGDFDFGGSVDHPTVRDVSWQTGRGGREAATRFRTREAAEHAASQVTGIAGDLMVVPESEF